MWRRGDPSDSGEREVTCPAPPRCRALPSARPVARRDRAWSRGQGCGRRALPGNAISCVTSMSRMAYAFSRDRAVPGWRLWSKVDRNGTPVNAIIGATVAGLVLTLPALFPNAAGIPVAFYAVVSVAVIGLYLSFFIPIALRPRIGDRFEPGPWTLGRRYKLLGWIAVIEIAVISVYFVLPIVPAGVPGNPDFTWSAVNYAPIAVGGVLLGVGLWWWLSARKWFTGPVRTVDLPSPRSAEAARADEPA
ncbi:amino acid permease [Micromonospora sp. NPDC049497]|uniref:amino acid permease n=1 Tax=Micromonospora sp. NPDC049497 TaxID=3364273 RepID=UPI00379E50CE